MKKKKKEERKSRFNRKIRELAIKCDNYEEKEIDEAIEKYKIRSPDTGNNLSKILI